jgi:alpha-tubulin suppressor-like RCC1 family protein
MGEALRASLDEGEGTFSLDGYTQEGAPMTRKSHLLLYVLLFVAYGVLGETRAWSQTVDRCVPPPPGLVAWYTGDIDGRDSAGNHHGTLLEGASIDPAKVRNGFHLDGRSGGVRVPNNPSINFGPGSFSIEAWVAVDPSVGDREYVSIATKLNASGQGFTFFLNTSGEIGLQLANSSSDWVNHFSPAPTVKDGRFHHVVARIDRSAGVSFYVDGVQTQLAPQLFNRATDVTSNGDLFFGRLENGVSCALKGVLDEVSIYNRALSAAEIGQLYTAGAAGKCSVGQPGAAGGSFHSLVLRNDGSLWAAGSNEYGQLGDDTNRDRNTFEQVLTDIVSTAANGNHTLALTADGDLLVTGRNLYGQLGDGTNSNRNTFEEVLTDVVSIASGGNHTLAVKRDGTLWAAGWNQYGQLGDGTNADRYRFVQVLTNVASVAADDTHTVAVKRDGTLWATGSNMYGELGDGTYPSRNTFVRVLTNVASAAAGGSFTHALKNDGTLWATGINARGQLGDGTYTSRNQFAQVLTNVASVKANNGSALALRSDGTLWVTGSNDRGQLGMGTSDTIQDRFVQVLTGVATFAAGAYHSLAVTTDGAVWATGDNQRGQLGDGMNIGRSTFARVAMPY